MSCTVATSVSKAVTSDGGDGRWTSVDIGPKPVSRVRTTAMMAEGCRPRPPTARSAIEVQILSLGLQPGAAAVGIRVQAVDHRPEARGMNEKILAADNLVIKRAV